MSILFPVNYITASPFGNLIGIILGDMKNEALKCFFGTTVCKQTFCLSRQEEIGGFEWYLFSFFILAVCPHGWKHIGYFSSRRND